MPSLSLRLPLRPIALWLGGGVLLYAAAVAWSGSAQTLAAVARIGAAMLLGGTLCASLAYLLRFTRWHLLLRWLGHRVPVGFNLRVYLAGLALTSSPGKLGETLRSALLLPAGVGLPHSLAAFFADRLSDVVGVAVLGALAARWLGAPAPVLEGLALIVIAGSFVARALLKSRVWPIWMARIDRHSVWGRRVVAVASPASAWAVVWSVPRTVVCVACAVAAYGVQALVFAAYVDAAGGGLSALRAVAIFCSATLLGAASLVPGGLGTMEAALILQLTDAGMERGVAVGAALATRLSTLWFSIVLGALMLLTFSTARQGGMHRTKP
jgi:uncharacterized membrane protein YbhN (UPF0104 family)